MTDVLNLGSVDLRWFAGGDLDVVNDARVSYAKYHEALEPGDDKLVHFLMSHRHGTPFEGSVFKFFIKCPLTVAREWQRHRIGSFNEMSGRYVELPEEYYVPAVADVRTQTGKAGSYVYEPMDEPFARVVADVIEEAQKIAFATYKNLLANGVAKELARTVLPVGTYTQFVWTVNARSLMNFLSLRTHPTAMHEIRQYANIIEQEFFAACMPITHEAFVKNGRIAP